MLPRHLSLLSFALVICLLTSWFDRSDSCQGTKKSSFSHEFKSEINANIFTYDHFERISDLDFECDIENNWVQENASLALTTFYFNFGFILDETIDLRPFAKQQIPLKVTLFNLKGFDIETAGPIVLADYSAEISNNWTVSIAGSKFEFYFKGEIIDEAVCNSGKIEAIDVKLFSGIASLGFMHTSFSRPACSYVFKNAKIGFIDFQNFETDLLANQALSLFETKNFNNLNISLNSWIYKIYIQLCYNLHLNTNFLSPAVFSHLESFKVQGKLTGIDSELFKPLHYINTIQINLNNLREFFHSSDNQWMAGLFSQGVEYESKQQMVGDINGDRNKILLLALRDNEQSYDYPEEDFCLFKYLPVKKAILMLIQFNNIKPFEAIKNRSRKCTFKFLLQNTRLFDHIFTTYYSLDTIEDFTQEQLDECEFEKLLQVCFNVTDGSAFSSSSHKFYTESYDSVYVLKWFDFLGPVITFPLFSAVAFTFNLIIVLVILDKKNRKEKLFESKMYKYILANSAFNCIECFLYEFRLINICISVGSVYCPLIKSTLFANIFGVYIIGYLGETVKTCSMLTGLLFSLQRYIETSKSSATLLIQFSSLKMRYILSFIIIASFLTSVIRIYEYLSTSDSLYDSPIQFNIYNNVDHNFPLVSVFYFFHYIVNDVVLLLVNLLIDVLLVREIKKDLNQKLNFNGSLESRKSVSFPSRTDLKALEKKKKVENKANTMIVITVLIYICCRLPEVLSKFFYYFYVPAETTDRSCQVNNLCYLIADLVEYMYMLAYTFNIFIYYRFNCSFRIGLKNFFRMEQQGRKMIS